MVTCQGSRFGWDGKSRQQNPKAQRDVRSRVIHMPSQDPRPTSGRIALVRHGRSAHVHSGWITERGFRAWRLAYEAAGIRENEQVPAHLAPLMENASTLLSSNAPRAVASARMLAPERPITVSPLLRELDLDAPALGGVRMPLIAWAVVVGGRTWHQARRGEYPGPTERARIANAAEWLGALAELEATIVAVTHASFRGELSKQLQRDGWQLGRGHRSMRPWSAWVLTRPRG